MRPGSRPSPRRRSHGRTDPQRRPARDRGARLDRGAGGTDEDPAESAAASGEPGEPGAEATCTGSDDNREFFEGIARAAEWPVLCGVLPAGWFVSRGSYRLANGGKLLISYKGPGGATIALSQGAFCTDDDGCVPDGSRVGGPPSGRWRPRSTRPPTGSGSSPPPAENPSWLLTTEGLDRATAVAVAAALAEVGR